MEHDISQNRNDHARYTRGSSTQAAYTSIQRCARENLIHGSKRLEESPEFAEWRCVNTDRYSLLYQKWGGKRGVADTLEPARILSRMSA